MDKIQPHLLMQELPLQSLSTCRPNRITVLEGDGANDKRECDSFTDSGGGTTIMLQNSIRNVCWRTTKDTLEIFEYSLDTDLYAASFAITFEGSKILPWVHVSFADDGLYIACCTLHAVHHIVLDKPNMGRGMPRPGTPQPSLLSGLPKFDFQDITKNCYFDEAEAFGDITGWSATSLPSETPGEYRYLAAAILTTMGKMNLITMTNKSISVSSINRASRVSRVLAGINPWGDAGGPEMIVDFTVVMSDGQAFILSACKDKKLRIWSFDTQDLIFNHDLSGEIPNPDALNGFENYKIRYCPASHVIAIFVGMHDHAEFMRYKVEFFKHNQISVFESHSASSATLVRDQIHCHLVDFAYSHDTITAIWRDAEENDVISLCESDSGVWHDVVMYHPPPEVVPLLPQRDVRESFVDHIFTPGMFDPAAILRSIQVRYSSSFRIWDLKDMVSKYIQSQIEDMMPEEGASDDILQVTAWNNLYQKLTQYQHVISRTVGIATSQGSDQFIMSVIKKGCVSVLAPVSTLESVCIGCDAEILKRLFPPKKCSDNDLTELKNMLLSLQKLHSCIGSEYLDSLLHSICFSGDSPYDVISDVTPEIVGAGIDDPYEIFDNVSDLITAVEALLCCLLPADCESDLDIPDAPSWPASTCGIEMLSHCVLRHITNRFELSTLLLIFLTIFKRPEAENDLLEEDSSLISRTTAVIEAHKSLLEISCAMVQNIPEGQLESKLRNLSLSESFSAANVLQEQGRSKATAVTGDKTVLEYFISGDGGKLVKGLLVAQSCEGDLLRKSTVTSCVDVLMYLLWPEGPSLALPDFLLNHCQFAVLQQYLQKCRDWCSWCPKSKEYMLAYCHLHAGNFSKAVKSFISAASGIADEDYMCNRLLNEAEETLSQAEQEVAYYTKIMPVFERLDLPEQVLALADRAIECTKIHGHDPNLPMLWSSKFRQNNVLARHGDSLKAIMHNPDSDHKKDCLRTFAVSLCERSDYKTLVELQYDTLEGDLVDILQHRSRGTEIFTSDHQYYDLLYAFHVRRGNFRKAASAMYEQGYQIGQGIVKSEGVTDSLRKQLNCYAACINCLYLVEDCHRWILHPVGNPVPAVIPESVESRPMRSNVIVHEIGDIKKELKLVEMKVKLIEISDEFPATSLGSMVSVSEISSFLCRSGLYDNAVSLCEEFDVPLTSIFESLASKCVRLSFADDKTAIESWEWLQRNETVRKHCTGGQSSFGNWTAADVAYRLLQVYLERYCRATGPGSMYFKATAKILLGFNATLPAWFVAAYKSCNLPELLRLLVCFDRLDEATSLTVEMIESAKSKLSIQFDAGPNKQKDVCLPFTVIEQLLSLLNSSADHGGMHQILYQTVDDYLDSAKSVSEHIVELRMQRIT